MRRESKARLADYDGCLMLVEDVGAAVVVLAFRGEAASSFDDETFRERANPRLWPFSTLWHPRDRGLSRFEDVDAKIVVDRCGSIAERQLAELPDVEVKDYDTPPICHHPLFYE